MGYSTGCLTSLQKPCNIILPLYSYWKIFFNYICTHLPLVLGPAPSFPHHPILAWSHSHVLTMCTFILFTSLMWLILLLCRWNWCVILKCKQISVSLYGVTSMVTALIIRHHHVNHKFLIGCFPFLHTFHYSFPLQEEYFIIPDRLSWNIIMCVMNE